MTSDTDLGEIEFRIDPRSRRLSLTLCPARRRLILTAPSQRRRLEAFRFLQTRLDWARRQLARLPEPRPFIPGGHILLRGESVMLARAPGRGAPVLDTEEGVLRVPGRPDAFAGRVARFLRAEAEADLTASLERHCAELGRETPPVTLRDTRSRWGSCSTSGRLNFSWRLICAPPHVLDYVAGHEAAHLLHHNHGADFRALEQRLCPRWREASDWLNRNGPSLHAVGAET